MRQLLKRDTLYVHFCDLMWVSGLCILWLYFVKVGCLCTLYISIVYCIWYISYSTSIIQDISHHISCVFVYLFTLFCKDFDLVYCIFRWYIVHNGCLYIAQDVFFLCWPSIQLTHTVLQWWKNGAIYRRNKKSTIYSCNSYVWLSSIFYNRLDFFGTFFCFKPSIFRCL